MVTRWVRDLRVAWTAAGLFGALALWCLFLRGEWKPTGDGSTIVHSRTGELRFSYSGQRVDDAWAEKEAARIARSDASR